jgi:hypothetical protein
MKYGCVDKDGDGFCDKRAYNTDSSGGRHGGDDCDDDNASAHPEQQETCNGRDDDCDGLIDEGLPTCRQP